MIQELLQHREDLMQNEGPPFRQYIVGDPSLDRR